MCFWIYSGLHGTDEPSITFEICIHTVYPFSIFNCIVYIDVFALKNVKTPSTGTDYDKKCVEINLKGEYRIANTRENL